MLSETDSEEPAEETADLREAKSKLEKEVEELTWRLQLEKRIRASIEETKKHENEKWQTIIREMQDQSKQTEEAKSKLEKEVEELTWRLQLEKRIRAGLEETKNQSKQTKEKEREAEIQILEEARVNNGVSSKEIVDKLNAKIEKLTDLVSSLEQKIDEIEKKYGRSNKLIEERLQQVNEAESKMLMNVEIKRLLDKINDMMTEEMFLRQQIVLAPPASNRCFSFSKVGPAQYGHLDIVDKLTADIEELKADMEETKNHVNEKWQTILKETKDQSKQNEEAKSKLEKEVEELTWRLQLEKRIRADLEETNNQVNVKWRTIVKEMHDQSKQTKEQFQKEREAVMKELEEACANKGASSNEIVDKLTAENEELKDTISSLEQKVDETEKKYEESNKLSEGRLHKVNEAESKMHEMNCEISRLHCKINELVSEEQILRQQVMLGPSASKRRFSFSRVKNVTIYLSIKSY